MKAVARHFGVLFLALRAGDAVNLAAGLWLVPKFVAPEALGAVLPVTTFATFLSLPVFAFGMAVMKDSSDLAGRGAHGALKALLRGVFVGVAVLAVLSLAATVLALPHHLKAMRVSDSSAGFFILASAFLGAVAPVYTDALQATKRFRTLGALELGAALARLATLAAVMPARAFAGYFAGGAVPPLVRIVSSVVSLRDIWRVRAERYWTRPAVRTLAGRFARVFAYLAAAMAVSCLEQNLLRARLPNADSAGYYMVTRLTDLLNYLTYPLLLVLFPYAAERTRDGRSTHPLVVRMSAVTLLAALALGIAWSFWGAAALAWLPHGEDYASYLRHVPALLSVTALTACQTLYTNAEVASGRFGFLYWFLPLNGVYAAALTWACTAFPLTLDRLLACFLAGAVLRFAGAAWAAGRQHAGSR